LMVNRFLSYGLQYPHHGFDVLLYRPWRH
jgi:hypothetical protein